LMGLEVPEELEEALEAYYAEKEQKEREMQEQMRQGGYTVGPDGKPLPAQNQPPKDGKQPMMDEAREEAEDKPKRKDEEKNPAPPQFQRKAWTPTAPEAEELRVWYEVAQRKLKRAEPMDFEYVPHHGGVPAEVAEQIKAKLLTATTAEDVRAAFVIAETVTPTPEYKSDVTASPDIMALAESINKLAETYKEKGNG
jgi:predicted ATP-grasp superfamily ATP-dependent carboligase